MDVAVIGLWHLGTVTAGCLAQAGYDVVAYDSDPEIIKNLNYGNLPVAEPNLDKLLKDAHVNQKIIFSNNRKDIAKAEIIWIAFDTPVDDNDVANVDYVVEQTIALHPHLSHNSIVLISSQVPIGTTHKIQKYFDEQNRTQEKNICFAYIPENLRLGKAIDVFIHPDRIVVGLDNKSYQDKISKFLQPFSNNIVWMSIASAEMTKHAINSFLALSVTFINELASLCEHVGANAYEVEKGLKSEERIGPKAYLHPGDAIAGGTLLRDINFLLHLGERTSKKMPLISAILKSNRLHQHWVRQKLSNLYKNLKGKKIAILGLTYKPGTNTLRRSTAIEMCQWLHEQGCEISAFDPAISELPDHLSKFIQIKISHQQAMVSADTIILATAWPDFRQIMPDDLIQENQSNNKNKINFIDPNGYLAKNMTHSSYINYYSVGVSPCI